jgi:4-nitrophenyl phosphatase
VEFLVQVSLQALPGGVDVSTALSDGEAVASARAVLLDWDGCIALGDRLQPAALRFMASRLDRVAVVSNNTTMLPEDFAAILHRAGLALPLDRIVLAGTEALARAVEIGPRRVMVLGDTRMRAYGRRLGLNIVREDADLVVLLRDTRFSYARLERAANALIRGADLVVANPDLVHPGPGGRVTPETGALLAALTACTAGAGLRQEVVGKPSERLFRRALSVLGVQGEEAVMIGDNPATDLAGAAAIGARGILIGPRSGLGFDELAAAAGR